MKTEADKVEKSYRLEIRGQ